VARPPAVRGPERLSHATEDGHPGGSEEVPVREQRSQISPTKRTLLINNWIRNWPISGVKTDLQSQPGAAEPATAQQKTPAGPLLMLVRHLVTERVDPHQPQARSPAGMRASFCAWGQSQYRAEWPDLRGDIPF
jgi:hypothetical protein